ncbi:MAG: enterochelin esterase [Gammaproteobacteria bacterium]|nr:enterochelin esterase [Gammaproteobacteria bacterium]
MHESLRNLMRKGAPSPDKVEKFIAGHSFPMVAGTDVTFVYHGDADEVFLRHWIFGLRTAQPLQRLADTRLWAVTIELPAESRIEYKYEVIAGGNRRLEMDSLNPYLARDPFGANSVCRGYRYQRPEWTMPDTTSRQGQFTRMAVQSTSFGDTREIDIYLPARYRSSRRYPLLIVHDGHDYLQYSDLRIVLDNLIHRLEIPPMIVALTTSPDRLKEYSGDERHANFICKELLPELLRELPISDEPQSRALMGASFGAVATLHAAWRNPGCFDRLLLQSGSFAFSDIGDHDRSAAFDPVVRFVNKFRDDPGQPAQKIYMSCGVYESLIYENRSMVPLLQAHEMQVRYEEVRDAHNWENWRDRMRMGLSWLFPGPLWMVYE